MADRTDKVPANFYAQIEAQQMSVDITGKIPANFYTQIESKKWTDRKEALEVIEKATSVPKIQNADFNDLVRLLKRTISKDSNIVVATLAAKCLCQLAKGLTTNFSPHATSSLSILFEKFKEKKPNVNSVIRDAADAAFVGTNLEEMHEDIIKFLDNKNPQIKSEMALFLVRTFSNFSSQVRNKKILKPIISALIKTLSDMDATVRDNSAMALGTAMKVIGENALMPILGDVEPIKIAKVKEFCEKAEIVTAPINGQNYNIVPGLTNGQESAPVTETNGLAEDGPDDEESLYDLMEAVDIVNQIPTNFFTQIESKKWTDRKEALEVIEKATSVPKIQNADFNDLVRLLKRTVSKDSNIVVATLAAKCLCQLAKGLRTNFSPHASSSLSILFEKFKEKKPNVNSVIRDAADAAFVGTNLEEMHEDIIKFLDNKNPQIKSEMALFLGRTFSNFSSQVLNKKILRPIINALIKTLSDMDATVRDNSAMAIGTAMKVIGENLMMPLIADVEPIKIAKIKEFCEKSQVKKVHQSVVNAASLAAPPVNNNHMAPPPNRSSSATMVRYTSSKKVPPKAASKPVNTVSSSNATVKRTATIIKRSTATKRASGLPHPPVAPHHPPAPHATPATNPLPPPPSQPPATPLVVTVQQQAQLSSTPVMPTFATSLIATKPSKQDNFDLVVFKLISDNYDEVIDSLIQLEESLTEEPENVFKSRVNQIIDLSSLQLIKSIYSLRTTPAPVTQVENSQFFTVKKVSDCLMKLFARRELVMAADQQSIRFLLVQIFTMTQTSCNHQEDEIVKNSLNELASAVMDSVEPSYMMSVLTGLLNDPPPISIVEPIKKAIIRSMRSFK